MILTSEIIEQDILLFEGIEVKLNLAEKFTRFYSEFYNNPLPDDATVDDLKIRVNEFVSNSVLLVYDK